MALAYAHAAVCWKSRSRAGSRDPGLVSGVGLVYYGNDWAVAVGVSLICNEIRMPVGPYGSRTGGGGTTKSGDDASFLSVLSMYILWFERPSPSPSLIEADNRWPHAVPEKWEGLPPTTLICRPTGKAQPQ